ncbi:hypothetical protein GALMADRAFT_249398 [Galerina marginata CBS 339.88]|uniref:Mediator complex subunit 1 n=1 Tax=Galerina marginata (strain CBS 339.88) TaxID=685588 RepID=A0A067SZ48_GALM3|nr:hypothetical protein GALMADRAFT_249398 [Galerina marginata CBS 339.88]
MQTDAPSFQTLLSLLESFQKPEFIPRNTVHPFATAAPATCDLLQDLINTTEQLSRSLAIYHSSSQWSNPKLTSLLRQHTSIEHTSYSSAKNVQHLIDALSMRPGVNYGESIPLLSTSFPHWCIQQLAAWGTSVGMETFIDESRVGGLNVVLGGKVLVIDVDFAIEGEDPLKPMLKVANVKTSNALLQGNANGSTSTMIDAFLRDSIDKYCVEMQKSEDSRNSLYAASLRKVVHDHLRYLVLLDRLASRKEDGGIRWFTDIDELCPTLIRVAKSEAEDIALSLSLPKAPLDVFLLRSHSLPLPYLTMPSISFLAYLSPSAYLFLIHNASGYAENENYPLLDLGLSDLTPYLDTVTKGVTVATLFLEKLSEAHLYPPSMSMPNITARPTFPLCLSAAELDHSFPQLDGFGMEVTSQDSETTSVPYAWVLDFTDGGKRPGVVISQSRMKAIELVVNPLGGGDGLIGVNDTLYSTRSWIDQLLNPDGTASPEHYTALYLSPNSLHPPLQLRLKTPEELGFTLERVPVHSIKEVWGILEVVREQCWLNETLLGCRWTSDGLKVEEGLPDEPEATEEDLQALLLGNFIPRKIPVNVILPSANTTDNLFGPTELGFSSASTPRITMTSPQRSSSIAGLVEITVTHDETRPRGVSVEISGAMGSDLKPADLEEICRRGGILSLPGRVWASGLGVAS